MLARDATPATAEGATPTVTPPARSALGRHTDGDILSKVGRGRHLSNIGRGCHLSNGRGCHSDGHTSSKVGRGRHTDGDIPSKVGRGRHLSNGRGCHSDGDTSSKVGQGQHTNGDVSSARSTIPSALLRNVEVGPPTTESQLVPLSAPARPAGTGLSTGSGVTSTNTADTLTASTGCLSDCRVDRLLAGRGTGRSTRPCGRGTQICSSQPLPQT